MHATLEPENLKTIQAVDHKKWGLGTRRKIGFRPLLGDGEFSFFLFSFFFFLFSFLFFWNKDGVRTCKNPSPSQLVYDI